MATVDFGRTGASGNLLRYRLRRWWMPSVRRPTAIVEVVVGTAAMVGLCTLFKPEDPLLLSLGFPWLAAFALIFALRYGALLGAVSGGCLLVAWWHFYGDISPLPRDYFTGLFTVLILAGHFSDRWANRIEYEASTNRYLHSRLSTLTNNYYLLRVSHDRVEQELLSRPTTLRDTIHHLRTSLGKPSGSQPLPHAQAFIDYLASVCQVNEAAVFSAGPRGIAGTSSAYVGADFDLDPRDPLVCKCVETGNLAHLREIGDTRSAYLACVPIRAATGELLGMLAVRRMFFMAFNHDTLQLMLVMLAYYADSLRQQHLVADVLRQVPACPEEMALELVRLGHLAKTGGSVSHLVALVFRKDRIEEAIYAQMVRQCRGLDLVWNVETDDARVMVVLLALTAESGVDGYITRMENILRNQFALDYNQGGVAVYAQAIGATDATDATWGLKQFAAHWSNP